jgi:hypothetical protein
LFKGVDALLFVHITGGFGNLKKGDEVLKVGHPICLVFHLCIQVSDVKVDEVNVCTVSLGCIFPNPSTHTKSGSPTRAMFPLLLTTNFPTYPSTAITPLTAKCNSKFAWECRVSSFDTGLGCESVFPTLNNILEDIFLLVMAVWMMFAMSSSKDVHDLRNPRSVLGYVLGAVWALLRGSVGSILILIVGKGRLVCILVETHGQDCRRGREDGSDEGIKNC